MKIYYVLNAEKRYWKVQLNKNSNKMMEVKQNTAVDLNDLLSSKNSGSDEVDDAIMSDLSDRNPHDLVNCGLMKLNDETENITDVENGDVAMTSLISEADEDVDANLNTTVNSELEDALLAEDDALPDKPISKVIEPALLVTEDILAEKAETSNSTTSSTNGRDPGDDLDTLLSKINDIVEDCIDNENENSVINTIKLDHTIKKSVETKEKSISNEDVSIADEKSLNDCPNLLEEEQSNPSNINFSNKSELNLETHNHIDNNIDNSDLPIGASETLDNMQEPAESEHIKSDIENDASVTEDDVTESEAQVTDDKKDTTQLNSTDNITENNLNIEKTEELNTEIVQDSKITSNSCDVSEDIKTTEPSTNGEDEIPKFDCAKISEKLVENQEFETCKEGSATQTNEKSPEEQTLSSANVGNEDSDDEIVFYVDQPPEAEKSNESEPQPLDKETDVINKTENSESKEETPSPEKKPVQDDDDIVLLLDDDDEEVSQIKKEESIKTQISTKDPDQQAESGILSTDGSTAVNEKDIVVDNSDNARDDFATETVNENEKEVDKTDVTETPEETNSNCSSSSNLLQEAKTIKNSVDEPTLEEVENEEEEDDGDVELIIGESKDSESLEKGEDSEISPPHKRIRLSEDDEEELKKQVSCDGSEEDKSVNHEEKQKESTEKSDLEKCSVTSHSTLKRSHDVIELEADEKSNDSKEANNKKPKTDCLNSDVVCLEKINEVIDDTLSEDVKYTDDDKKDVKAIPSYEPIRLYPPPKFGVLKCEMPMSLEFLKKFRKSFDNMTKQDLEELVLQKVVEAIIHRSEFSEMRELIEKQEKLISAHRTKISELSKQFRDLEMVHNRVVKDIEQRNSQFIMPVKITRAVGLQVYIPNKKSLAEASSSTTVPNIPSSPQRPVSSQASSTSTTSLTPPQRQFQPSQSDTQHQRPAAAVSSGPGNTGNVRRGCVQKITPIRPVPGTTQSTSAASTAVASSTFRNTTNLSAATQPRILNKNATSSSNSNPIPRSRFLSSSQDGQRMQTQQISRSSNLQANSQRIGSTATQSKPASNVATTVHRRSEPSQGANSASSSIVDNYINTLTHLTGGNTAVSITPAKPKEKAVIDLTDEDETPSQSAGAQPVTQIPGTQAARRSLPVQNSSNSQLQYGRTAPPLARVQPANQMANKNRQISSLQAQKNSSFTSISTPPGTSITRINVSPSSTNVQRVKYSHPAPLPATPPQAFNPSWKLPPPRPTIRISNLDNGIVISWTMEESMDRHAECVSYQIYAYQETSGPPMVDSWRHVGDVKAMLLPMAVTLTQFQEGQRYYFAVRAVDCHQRYGPFSLPKTWS